jgi:hypothetical protein
VLVAGAGSAELYDPASGRWTATADMDGARRDHTATLLGNGTVLVAGGDISINDASDVLASAELYHPDSGS